MVKYAKDSDNITARFDKSVNIDVKLLKLIGISFTHF